MGYLSDYQEGLNAKPSVSVQAFICDMKKVNMNICESTRGNKVLHVSSDIAIFMTGEQLKQLAEVIRVELEKGEADENIQDRDKELAGA